MKKVTYQPKSKEFNGEVLLGLPSVRQRLRYLKEANLSSASGKIVSISDIEGMEKLYDITAKHVLEVKLEHESGVKYKSFDELTEDSLCDEICNDVMSAVFEGGLGKKSR